MHEISFAAVDELVTALEAAGIREGFVGTDPAKLNLPGILLEVERIRFELLDGAILNVRVSLISPSTDQRVAMGLLAELFNTAAGVLDPEDDVLATTIPLPEQSQPMPCLQLTHAIPIT